MSYPAPKPGLVIRYSFLWSHEADTGAEEGSKDRPCAIVVAAKLVDGEIRTIVAPITHLEPDDLEAALELPAEVSRALKLDDARHWLKLDELNRFAWPGYDLRQIPGGEGDYAYGMLPQPIFEGLRERIVALGKAGKNRTLKRDSWGSCKLTGSWTTRLPRSSRFSPKVSSPENRRLARCASGVPSSTSPATG